MYDVALSFAGEDREYVEAVAAALAGSGVKVFYDAYERSDLWGKNLYEHLTSVYKDDSRYVVVFVSKHYAHKVWTTHERRAAQARALVEHSDYILPARFDDTDIPGLLNTVGHVSLVGLEPGDFAKLILEKVRNSDYWLQELAEAVDFCGRVLLEAHRGAFLWRRDVTAVFDNRLNDRDDPYVLSLRESLSEIALLAATVDGVHPIVLLYQTDRAHDLHAAVWGIWSTSDAPVRVVVQKAIADRVLGSVMYQPVRGPME